MYNYRRLACRLLYDNTLHSKFKKNFSPHNVQFFSQEARAGVFLLYSGWSLTTSTICEWEGAESSKRELSSASCAWHLRGHISSETRVISPKDVILKEARFTCGIANGWAQRQENQKLKSSRHRVILSQNYKETSRKQWRRCSLHCVIKNDCLQDIFLFVNNSTM